MNRHLFRLLGLGGVMGKPANATGLSVVALAYCAFGWMISAPLQAADPVVANVASARHSVLGLMTMELSKEGEDPPEDAAAVTSTEVQSLSLSGWIYSIIVCLVIPALLFVISNCGEARRFRGLIHRNSDSLHGKAMPWDDSESKSDSKQSLNE
jgi:hypothetical protein